MANKVVTATVSAQNTFTLGISPTYKRSSTPDGRLNISIGGSGWVAVITLQRTFDAGATWLDVTTYSSPEEAYVEEFEEEVLYRLGCKTGDFTSGSIPLRLSR
jgi:hypothetical protein